MLKKQSSTLPIIHPSIPLQPLASLTLDLMGRSNQSTMDTKKGIGALIPEFISRLR